MSKTKKSLDNQNQSSNTGLNSLNSIENPDLSHLTVSKQDNPGLSIKQDLPDDNEYTIDPITGEKYLLPKGDSVFIGQRAFRLPPIVREGFEVIWEVNRGNNIQERISEGWRHVDPETPGCENAAKRPYAGKSDIGKSLHHVAMQMPKSRYDEMMRARSQANTDKENEIIFNPSMGQGKDFYIAKEHKAPFVTTNAGGMDPAMAAAYNKAMR
jgi:hypothetical protein